MFVTITSTSIPTHLTVPFQGYSGYEDATPRPSIDFPTAVIEVSLFIRFLIRREKCMTTENQLVAGIPSVDLYSLDPIVPSMESTKSMFLTDTH
uniref:Uncharacterized protein n=1 Tax=Caenorhabditis tropicalis TaxID=1561998 RepID=A0A1I7TCT6_9PELO